MNNFKWPEKAWPYLLFWLLLNLVQSFFTELFNDEAYYWFFSQHLDWGYFDHPPAAPLLIAAGYSIFQNELGVRLFIVIASTLSQYLIWKAVVPKRTSFFFAISLTPLLVQFGGFMAAPDLALMLSSSLFYYLYKQYLSDFSWTNAFLTALAVAAMAYSKYHGGLVIIFAFLAYPAVIKKASFWLIPVLVLAVYWPHMLWEYNNDFITFRFHLTERSPEPYSFLFPVNYILGQLLMVGPLISIPLFYGAFKFKASTTYERCLKWCFYGILGFFFLNSLRGRVEANWTATAFMPLFYMSYHYYKDQESFKKLFFKLVAASWVLIVFLRIYLMVDFLPKSWNFRNEFHGWEQWAQNVSEKAGDLPVLFDNDYKRSSKYSFYTGKFGHSINLIDYSGNQYDMIPELEQHFQGKKVAVITKRLGKKGEAMEYPDGDLNYYNELDFFTSYNRVRIYILNPERTFKANTEVNLQLQLVNPTKDTIRFDLPQTAKPFLAYKFFLHNMPKGTGQAPTPIGKAMLLPGEKWETDLLITTPDAESKKLRLRAGIRLPGFYFGRNSHFYKVKID